MAVRRGRARPGRRLPDPRRPGDRRQRAFYNQTGSHPDPPDPGRSACSACSTTCRRAGAAGFTADGRAPGAARRRPRRSSAARSGPTCAHGHLGGRPPAVDLEAERGWPPWSPRPPTTALLASAHDLSDGGLAIALAEACLRGASAARSRCPATRSSTCSASRRPGRWSASPPAARRTSRRLAQQHGVPATVLGTAGGDTLTVAGAFEVPLAELERAWTGTLPAIFG